MINKLKLKFVFVNMAIVTIMLTIIFGLLIFLTKSNMERESVQMLRSVAMLPIQPEHSPDISTKTAPFFFSVQKTPNGDYFAYGSNVIDFSDNELLSKIFDEAIKSKTQTGVIKEYNLRYYIRDSHMFQNVLFADISSEKLVLEQLVRTCFFIFVLSFGGFFIVSILLSRWMIKPVEKAWKEQKQFVADASHELKTPLTVIMTNAEMLLDKNHSEESKMQFSENILTMSHQMRELTENLLELARSDNHTSTAVFQTLDFSQLVSDSVLPFEPLYYEKGLQLECDIQAGISITGDSTHLCRLTDILLDNAMKYSYQQTIVSVKLKSQNNYCTLSVASKGDVLTKAELKSIFTRFYRIDKARTSNHSYGLGLSIAESICHEHNGRIWAESVNNTNTFFVRLPIK